MDSLSIHRPLMASLNSCWGLVETILIPNGAQKWHLLGYFIHPLLLLFCRLFLLGRLILVSVFFLLNDSYRGFRRMISWLIGFLERSMSWLILVMELDDASIIRLYGSEWPRQRWFDQLETEEEEDPFRSVVAYHSNQVLSLGKVSKTEVHNHADESNVEPFVLSQEKQEENNEKEYENEFFEEQEDQEKPISYFNESQVDRFSNGLAIEEQRRNVTTETQVDEFYDEYKRRMQWLDQINGQSICAISRMLIINVRDSSLLENMEVHLVFLTERYGEELIGSLESSFEMVYVAQTCLSWETLCYNYRKIEEIAYHSGQDGVFRGDVATKYQQFKVLVERFTENGRIKGKRYLNYIRHRFDDRNRLLLQVPSVADYVDEVEDGDNAQAISARDMLRIMDKAIIAFMDFIEEDNCKTTAKFKKLLHVGSQVENPNDLGLLVNLAKELHKKEMKLKDVQGLTNSWWKKKRSSKKSCIAWLQRKEALFSMIEIKVVSRVLKMSVISTQQLKWCEEKLNNIQIRNGSIVRTYNPMLFPHS